MASKLKVQEVVLQSPNGLVEKTLTMDNSGLVSINNEPTSLVGAIQAFATITVPNGWLKANGQAISRTTYASLFSVIGTTYGSGDGSTTFNVPDLRGEFIRGFDDGKGTDSGRVFGSSQTDDFKSHTHSYNFSNSSGAYVQNIPKGELTTAGTSSSTILATGGTETRPKNIALLYCIKY